MSPGSCPRMEFQLVAFACLATEPSKAKRLRRREGEPFGSFQKSWLLHLNEDDDQSEQGQGLDEGQAEHQQQLDAGAGAGVAGEGFGCRSRSEERRVGKECLE